MPSTAEQFNAVSIDYLLVSFTCIPSLAVTTDQPITIKIWSLVSDSVSVNLRSPSPKDFT